MSVMMVRQKIKDGRVEAAEAAARDLFATLARERLEGIRYASTRVGDSATFVVLLELADGREDPRRAIPAYQRFLEQLQGWVDGPPVIEHLTVVGSYQLLDPSARRSDRSPWLRRTPESFETGSRNRWLIESRYSDVPLWTGASELTRAHAGGAP